MTRSNKTKTSCLALLALVCCAQVTPFVRADLLGLGRKGGLGLGGGGGEGGGGAGLLGEMAKGVAEQQQEHNNGGGLLNQVAKDAAEKKDAGGNGLMNAIKDGPEHKASNNGGGLLGSMLKNSAGQAVGGGPKGASLLDKKQFSGLRNAAFFSGGARDAFGNAFVGGLLIADIVVNSVNIAGYWSGGCVGCGQFYYNNGGSSCPPCECFFVCVSDFFR